MLEDYLLALEHIDERLRALDAQTEQTSLDPRYATAVAALRCFRGIDTLTAMCLIAELHDFMRFESARGLMAYLGLVPSEHSSEGKERRGEIASLSPSRARRITSAGMASSAVLSATISDTSERTGRLCPGIVRGRHGPRRLTRRGFSGSRRLRKLLWDLAGLQGLLEPGPAVAPRAGGLACYALTLLVPPSGKMPWTGQTGTHAPTSGSASTSKVQANRGHFRKGRAASPDQAVVSQAVKTGLRTGADSP